MKPTSGQLDLTSPSAVRSRQMAALFAQHGVGVGAGRGRTFTEANDELLRILGRDRSDLLAGLGWDDVTLPEQAGRDRAAEAEVEAEGTTVLTKDLVRPDGERVPVLVAVTLDATDPEQWVALVVDLSPRERLKRLAQSEAALVSTLLEDAPVGFALIDPELRFVRVNRELAAMNGFAAADHEGVPVFDLVPELRDAAEPLLRGVLDTGTPVRDVHIVGTTQADPGHEHTWSESFFPIRLDDGPVLGVAAIARDVTELVSLQAELDATLVRQRDALRELQASLMPALPRVEGIDLAARYLASSDQVHLGGDWLDVLLAPDGRLVLLVGDVVGHGPSAVGLTARLSGAVRAAVCGGAGPSQVLSTLNAVLTTDDLVGLATAFVAFLDRTDGRIEFASAGHPHPYLRSPGGTARPLVVEPGVMLGCFRGSTYETSSDVLPPRAALVLFTDGLVERRREDLDDGLSRLAAAVQSAAGTGARGLLDAALEACLAGRERDDDVCVLTLVRA
ncbi:MAG: SpoIIE family protein phosphatase [Kineosporiaceae bacterium]